MTLCASGTVTPRKSSAFSISGMPASLEGEEDGREGVTLGQVVPDSNGRKFTLI